MKRNLRFCLFSLILLMLAGCVDIDVSTKIKSDGSGIQSWKFSTTALLATQIRQQVERDPFFSKEGRKLSEEYKEGDYILTVDIPFEDANKLSDKGREVHFQRSGFLKRTYVFSETWKPSFAADSDLVKKRAGSLVPVTLKLSVDLPGKIIESNASTVDRHTARWSFPITDLIGSGSKTITVKSQQWNQWVMIPLGGLIFIGMIALLAAAVSGKKALRQCGSCGKSIPARSAFCNFCGTKV